MAGRGYGQPRDLAAADGTGHLWEPPAASQPLRGCRGPCRDAVPGFVWLREHQNEAASAAKLWLPRFTGAVVQTRLFPLLISKVEI